MNISKLKIAAAVFAAMMTIVSMTACGNENAESEIESTADAQISAAEVTEDSFEESAEAATTTTTTAVTTEAPEELPDDSSEADLPEAEPYANKNRTVVENCVLEQDDFMVFDDPTENYLTRWYEKGYVNARSTVCEADPDAITYRGIKVGSSGQDVLDAYGDTELVTLDLGDDIIYLRLIVTDAEQPYLDAIENAVGFYEYGGFLPADRAVPMKYTAGLRFYVDENDKVTSISSYLNYYTMLIGSYDAESGWSKISGIVSGNDTYSLRGAYLSPMYQLGRVAQFYALDYSRPLPVYHFGEDGVITVEYKPSLPTTPIESILEGATYTEEEPGSIKVTLADGSDSYALKWSSDYGTYLLFGDPSAAEYCAMMAPVVP